jgi:FtsP/CotA-like multicopper oxidase with cupredoxin domain
VLSAAAFTASAGAIHLAVVPDHFEEYVPFGLFFLAVGLAQMAAAAAILYRPCRRLLLALAAANAGLLALWLVSRTSGLPIGPDPGIPEPIGFADAACASLEVLSLPALLILAIRGRRPRPPHRVRTILAAAPALITAAWGGIIGVGSGLSGMPVAYSVAPAGSHSGAASVTTLTATRGSEPLRTFTLTARPGLVGGHDVYTYDGTVPGPELRVKQGDRVRVLLVNRLPVSTTLHWHGVRVPNAADGVAGITQDAVAPGRSFSYEFVASDAGTYWYHSHQDTTQQIEAGLFGALVVEPRGYQMADLDTTMILHSATNGAPAVAVNGITGDVRVPARPGSTVHLRLIDAVAPSMDGTVQAPVLLGAPYRVVALDGHALHAPRALGPRRLVMGMGQRVDLTFTLPRSGAVRLVDSQIPGETSALQRFFGPPAQARETVTFGSGTPPPGIDPERVPIFDPLTYGTSVADPSSGPATVTSPVVLREGPGFHDGAIQLVHTINGAASPRVPPIVVHTGDFVRLHIVNDTGEFHPMHLHGHVMTVLAAGGRSARGSPIHLDTVLLAPRQTVDIAFRADNPGIWMLHCHVLLHARMGMSMTVNYAGVTTPFEMGSRSGNTPE